ETALAGAEHVLVFSPPEQVLSWVCGGTERGYMLYFKPELLATSEQLPEEIFPFFETFTKNVLPLTEEDRALLVPQFERLRTAFRSGHSYRRQQLGALTTALLLDCRVLYEREARHTPASREPNALATSFRQMVARCFQDHCTIESY